MAYIDTKYLGKCETCRHCVGEIKCDTYCDHGECYSPNMFNIPTADVASRSEVATEVFDAVKDTIYAVYNKYVFGNTGYVDREIEAVIDALTETMDDVSALKKKYTEEDNEKA